MTVPLISLVVAAVLKIILNNILVSNPNIEIMGVGISSIICQGLALIICIKAFKKHIKLEFDAKGQIKDMDAQGKKALPDSSIPAMIVDYVKENFTGSKIMEWSQSRKLQVVELDNDIELVFDRHGNLVKIDD